MYWCATLNNFTDNDFESFIGFRSDVSYSIIGKEVGANGTPHLQCYFEFSKKKRLTWLRANLSERAHYESRKGTPQQAADYCKKEGLFYEYGNVSRTGGQGKRNDLIDVWEEMRDHRPLREILAAHPATVIRNLKNLKAIDAMMQPKRDFQPYVTYIYGATGVGKSMFVHQREVDVYVHYDSSLGKWNDGYENEAAYLDDEFTGDMPVAYYNGKYDRYPFKLEMKGASTEFNSRRIYILSNYSIAQIARDKNWTAEQEEQFRRRMDEVHHLHKQQGAPHTWINPLKTRDQIIDIMNARIASEIAVRLAQEDGAQMVDDAPIYEVADITDEEDAGN